MIDEPDRERQLLTARIDALERQLLEARGSAAQADSARRVAWGKQFSARRAASWLLQTLVAQHASASGARSRSPRSCGCWPTAGATTRYGSARPPAAATPHPADGDHA